MEAKSKSVTKSKRLIRIRPVENKGGLTPFSVYPNTRKTLSPYFDEYGGISHFLEPVDEERLSKIMGIDLSRNAPFWKNFSVVLTDKETTLDLDVPVNELQYLFLRSHMWVANSVSELTAFTMFVIYDEEEEAKVEVESFDALLEAFSMLHNMSYEAQRDFVKLFPGGRGRVETVSPAVIKKKLKQLAELDPRLFIKLNDDPNKGIKILIADLLENKIITKKGPSYYYGEDMLGVDLEAAVAHLKTPKYNDLLISLKKQLEVKKANKV